jgi:hypothetical protein
MEKLDNKMSIQQQGLLFAINIVDVMVAILMIMIGVAT